MAHRMNSPGVGDGAGVDAGPDGPNPWPSGHGVTEPYYADASVTIWAGDCLDVLPTLPDNSVDCVVTDPPYSLGFMGRTWDSHHEGHEDAAFCYWFSGFTDGEGCFRVQRHERGTFTCTFSIKLRRDERGTLERIQRFFGGIGTIRDGEGTGNANPQTTWAVQDKAGCKRLVQHFDKYQLRAKKRLDYEPWAAAVMEWHDMKRGNRWHGMSDWSRMAQLKARVESARQYVDPPWSGHGFQDWCRLWAAECFRILKPGGHMLAFGATRQSHRLAAGIEDAGFEIRDSIAFMFGAGFPKSLNVGRAIDGKFCREAGTHVDSPEHICPTTPQGDEWRGHGSALKPGHEPICVARKPLAAGTVAANVLRFGTGALNIDACRIGTEPTRTVVGKDGFGQNFRDDGWQPEGTLTYSDARAGRWPANVVLDESQAAALDQMSEGQRASKPSKSGSASGDKFGGALYGSGLPGQGDIDGYDDGGGASRFFYTAKASSEERITHNGVSHPTVKSLSLMRWLVRLVTPPGGLILEPFAGSGTTVEAAILEGFRCVAIEREADYLPLIVQRINRRRDPIAYITAAGEDLGLFGLDDDLEPAAQPQGRWPANVVLDRSQAEALDQMSGELGGGFGSTRGGGSGGEWNPTDRDSSPGQTIRGDGRLVGYGDSGGASRFFKVVDEDEESPDLSESTSETGPHLEGSAASPQPAPGPD